MNARQFFDLVVEMRKNQRTYFNTRNNVALEQSKQLERLVDNEIKRVQNVLSGEQDLFGND